MTVGGNSPYDPGAELPPPNYSAPGAFPQAGAPWPVSPATAPPQRRGGLLTTGIAGLALAMATGALVVGGIALTRHSAPTATSTSSSATDTSAADKALCEAVAPILAESDKLSNTYTKLGDAGSAPRDAATPKFITDTKDWTQRAQDALDANPDAAQLLRRTLQRYIEDRQILIAGLEPGPLPPYQETIWSDSMAAYNGPISICAKLGVKW